MRPKSHVESSETVGSGLLWPRLIGKWGVGYSMKSKKHPIDDLV